LTGSGQALTGQTLTRSSVDRAGRPAKRPFHTAEAGLRRRAFPKQGSKYFCGLLAFIFLIGLCFEGGVPGHGRSEEEERDSSTCTKTGDIDPIAFVPD
jgi:hypothetical protein